MDFVGGRLRLGRTFRALTQAELGKKVAASSALISQLETGEKREPSATLEEAFAEVLGFEREFFHLRIEDEFTEEECNFRRLATTPKTLRKRVLAQGTLLGMVVSYLRSNLEFPEEDVPQVLASDSESIERAAELCREHWGLGMDTPVLSMGRVLERAGVVLIEHDARTSAVDAFSRAGKVLMVVLNTSKGAASRVIFDLAHEAGHLVMHRGLKTGTAVRENEANRFAGAFLLPRDGFTREFPRQRWDWEYLFQLKRRWRTSLAAIIRRAYDLDLIDAARYRTAYKYLSLRGWRKDEPYEPEPEQPELLSRAFAALEEIPLSALQVARELRWKPATFEEITGVSVAPPVKVVDLGNYKLG